MELTLTSLAERPELLDAFVAMDHSWPEFVQYDPVGWSHWDEIVKHFPDHAQFALAEDGSVVARALSVPFALYTTERGELPDTGWDQTLLWAFSDLREAAEPDTVGAVEVTIATGQLGRGLSARMLDAMRGLARSKGFEALVAPVRPSGKQYEPHTPMDVYLNRTRADQLPEDPWLRVHARAGGSVEKVAPASMTVAAGLAQWRTWTGQPFDTEGPVVVPGGIVPVECRPTQGYAVYVEPNVWVRHTL